MKSAEKELVIPLVEEYLSMFKRPEFNFGIQQCSDEISQVVDFLNERKFNNFLEIGSDEAGSLWLYANLLLAPGANIIATDMAVKPILKRAVDTLSRRGFDARWVESRSEHLDIPDGLDLVHIDGDHSLFAVRADFSKIYPKVVDGGVILLHDTLLWDGCIAFAKELERDYGAITFAGHNLISGHWGVNKEGPLSTGITLVQK